MNTVLFSLTCIVKSVSFNVKLSYGFLALVRKDNSDDGSYGERSAGDNVRDLVARLLEQADTYGTNKHKSA